MRYALRYEWGLAGDAIAEYRITLFADIDRIKRRMRTVPHARISDCAEICDVDLQAVAANRLAAYKNDCAGFRDEKKVKEDRLLSSIFGAREIRNWRQHEHHKDVRIAFATAHSSKGETHDAVLLVTE